MEFSVPSTPTIIRWKWVWSATIVGPHVDVSWQAVIALILLRSAFLPSCSAERRPAHTVGGHDATGPKSPPRRQSWGTRRTHVVTVQRHSVAAPARARPR